MTQIHPGYVVRAVDDEAAAKEIEDARAARIKAFDEMERYCATRFIVEMEHYAFGSPAGGFSLTGFKPKDPRAITPGQVGSLTAAGLRWDAKERVYVPAKRTDAGKALVKEMKAFSFSYPYIQGLGGVITTSDTPPDTPTHLSKHYFSGWHFWVYDTGPVEEDLTIDPPTGDLISLPRGGVQVFAGFGPAYLDEKGQQRVIDAGDRWRPATLSAYHLAREAHLAAHPEPETTEESDDQA